MADRRSMRYTDQYGHPQTLTWLQAYYLDVASEVPVEYGWGGLDSTRTVHLLHFRGLVALSNLSEARWEIDRLTPLGQQVLRAWNGESDDDDDED